MGEEGRVSFFSKSKVACPVCRASFVREELLTGRGRLIAGRLTKDLRRLYDPSQKFGKVYPLIYPVVVCPSCYYAAFASDFHELADKSRRAVELDAERRLEQVFLLFDEVDFREPRGLKEGVAGYLFAMMCYDHFPDEACPTIKQGLSALRAAWVASDLEAERPGENWSYLAQLFYRKARFFYIAAIDNEQSGTESIGTVPHLGPDLDKNYGYDGVLYLAAYLELQYGPREDDEKRIASLKSARRTVARLFGLGRATRDKPTALLDLARELYDTIGVELTRMGVHGET